jgi:hypothetical protein
LPWVDNVFQTKWREIARAVGVVMRRTTTAAGAATDAEIAGADIEKVRPGLGHSKAGHDAAPSGRQVKNRAHSTIVRVVDA